MKFSNWNEQQWQFKKGRKKLWYVNLSLSSSTLFHPFKKSPPNPTAREGAAPASLESEMVRCIAFPIWQMNYLSDLQTCRDSLIFSQNPLSIWDDTRIRLIWLDSRLSARVSSLRSLRARIFRAYSLSLFPPGMDPLKFSAQSQQRRRGRGNIDQARSLFD